MDQEWVVATEASNRNARHVLQGRLSTAQSHLHKEAIRTAYIALAQHDLKTGELRDALSSLLRATDYCTTRSQTAPISLMILELSFGLEEYGHVREYVTKVEHTLGAANSTTTASNTTPTAASPSPTASLQDVSIKLKIASGLERLAQGEYAAAANIFTKLTMTMNMTNLTTSTTSSSAKMAWSGVTCAEDIALYASLLSLATQDRSSILELAEHPEALELVPAMKDLLSQWSRANYATCLQAFSDSDVGKFVPVGDLYLSGPRWKALSQKIREKCLMEYLRPYQCVRLDSMSQLFPSIHNLQDTLVDLMGRGLIPNAKMDARANVLYKTEPKPSVELAAMEQRVLDDTHAMLIRLGCLEYDLSVQDAVPRGRRAAVAAAAAARYDDESSDDEGDTPMLDADPQNSAANPEDLY
jgi:COP9 signalosome complex subunit 1